MEKERWSDSRRERWWASRAIEINGGCKGWKEREREEGVRRREKGGKEKERWHAQCGYWFTAAAGNEPETHDRVDSTPWLWLRLDSPQWHTTANGKGCVCVWGLTTPGYRSAQQPKSFVSTSSNLLAVCRHIFFPKIQLRLSEEPTHRAPRSDPLSIESFTEKIIRIEKEWFKDFGKGLRNERIEGTTSRNRRRPRPS